MSLTVIGIDPGKKGAAVLLHNGYFESYADWSDGPTLADTLKEWIMLYEIDYAFLEKVHSMPKQGVVSSFTFGANFGWWQGALDMSHVPWRLVQPQEWQKGLIPKKRNKTDKPSLTIARRMFPEAPLDLKKHDGRADAALIAYWGYKQLIK